MKDLKHPSLNFLIFQYFFKEHVTYKYKNFKFRALVKILFI